MTDGMTRETAQAVAIMADAVYTWLESNMTAYNVGFEFLPLESPALMLQTQTTDPVAKEYKSGRRLYRYEFGLLLRMDNSDTASRLNNQRELIAICDAVLGADLDAAGFRVWEIRQDTTPRVMSTDDGMDVCLATLHVDYEKVTTTASE